MISIINPQKWRGIKTTSIPKNELKAKTIINRFDQKSISLPRIDDKKRWSGYPGITGVSRKLAKLIPLDVKYYVEPFAGTAKVYQEYVKLRAKSKTKLRGYTAILNDKSEFVYDWLQKEFGFVDVTCEDFTDCVLTHDSKKTMFVFDQPWFQSYYDQVFSCFDRESVKQYDEEVLKLCHKLKGKFIITTRKENKLMLQSGFTNKLVTSEYVVSGKYPKVLITTNLDWRKQN